jgi:hypothetical protein
MTMTRLLVLRPVREDLVDAGFMIAAVAVALLGFRTTFDSWFFLVVGLAGALLGIVAAHVANTQRWHWVVTLVMAVAIFFGLGGVVALPQDAIGGVVPSLSTLTSLATLGVTGWKELLTTLMPVDGSSEYLVLPYLLTLVTGAAGYSVARRTRKPWPALVMPLALFAAVLLLGGYEPPFLLAQGLGLATLCFAWLTIRTGRRRRLVGTGIASGTRVATGAALVAVALVGGAFLGPMLPGIGTSPRLVLRTYVQPPIDETQYPSPLPGFRKYSGASLKLLYDQDLLSVQGASGAMLRFAVLDDYTGTVWSASGGSSSTGFQRVGSSIPGGGSGTSANVTVTVKAAYAATQELNQWVPGLGSTSRITFSGSNQRSHVSSMRYNLSTGQAVVTDRLKEGDVVSMTTTALPTVTGSSAPSPDGSVVISDTTLKFVTPTIQKLAAQKPTSWDKLMAVAAAFQSGAWSDGTRTGEGQYLPGDGQGRLSGFLNGDQLVGSDEQYAASFALVANKLGYPARVVFGAVVPQDGVVRGQDVKVWVEVSTTDGWQVISPDKYVPDRNHHPDNVPPAPVNQNAPIVVPPPNPVQPPGSLDSVFDAAISNKKPTSGSLISDALKNILMAVLTWGGPPVAVIGGWLLLVAVGRALRRRRRHSRGQLTTRIAGGWVELLDRARDLGVQIPNGTRREQSRLLPLESAPALAAMADQSVFGAGDPDKATVSSYWTAIHGAVRELRTSATGWRRLQSWVSPASLLRPAVLTSYGAVAASGRKQPRRAAR